MNFLKEFEMRANIVDRDLIKVYINFCIENDEPTCNGEVHHILPSSIFPEYKDLNIFNKNKTKLSYTNHLKAHYLLTLSIDSPEMFYAFNMMNNFYNKNNIANLLEYENLKLNFVKLLKDGNWVKSSKDKKWIFKDGKYLFERGDVLRAYLKNGWLEQGNATGLIWVNDGIISRRVRSDNFLYHNWNKGRLGYYSEEKTWINKDNVNKLINISDKEQYMIDGWKSGAWNTSATKDRVRISLNNVNKTVSKADLDKYFTLGWSLGAYKVQCSECNEIVSSLGKQNHKCKGKNHEYIFNFTGI